MVSEILHFLWWLDGDLYAESNGATPISQFRTNKKLHSFKVKNCKKAFDTYIDKKRKKNAHFFKNEKIQHVFFSEKKECFSKNESFWIRILIIEELSTDIFPAYNK